MGTISRQYTYAAGNTINPDENNANENALFNEVNGGLDNDNIDASAAISESKLSFNTSTGHKHDGSDSAAIPNGYGFAITGTLTTGTNLTNAHIIIGAQTVTKAYAYVKTAPTAADLIIDINLNGTSIWATTQANRLTVSAGDTEATQTSFDTTALSDEDVITVDIDQVGSSVSGADLTIVLK
jgi:hypothetical protein